jgi:ribosomal protein L40E
MKCVNCNEELNDGVSFCTRCGTSVNSNVTSGKKYCIKCGSELELNSNFCTKCGSNQNNVQNVSNSNKSDNIFWQSFLIGIFSLFIVFLSPYIVAIIYHLVTGNEFNFGIGFRMFRLSSPFTVLPIVTIIAYIIKSRKK